MKTLPFNIDGIYPLDRIHELQSMSESNEKPWAFEFIGVEQTFDLSRDPWAQANQEQGDHLSAFLHTSKILIPDDVYDETVEFFKQYKEEHLQTNNPTEIIEYFAGVMTTQDKQYTDVDEVYREAIVELANDLIFTDTDLDDLKDFAVSLH
jgi:hypothetical protein